MVRNKFKEYMAALFSERYGYVKPQDALITECMPKEVINSLCTLLEKLSQNDENNPIRLDKVERVVWCQFLNNRFNDIYTSRGWQKAVIEPYLLDDKNSWLKKMDLLEFTLQTMQKDIEYEWDNKKTGFLKSIHNYINAEFERLHYGYRVINNCITPITSKEEIHAIEDAVNSENETVTGHLNQALQLFANRENPDYRNSIKESISAVEVICRELTGEDTLGRALDVLMKKGIKIHPMLKSGMHKLYEYTNKPEVGARHGLMDDSGDYIPSYNEAYYMLVSCSAFINYLRGIVAKNQ